MDKKITFLYSIARNGRTFQKEETYKCNLLFVTMMDAVAYYTLELVTGDIITVPDSAVIITNAMLNRIS